MFPLQDNLHNFGRNPDKEVGAHIGKLCTAEPTLPARSSVQDVYGSGVQHILADNGYDKEDPPRLRRQASNSSLDGVALKQILHSSENDNSEVDTVSKLASFANLSRQSSDKGINLTYTEQEQRDDNKPNLSIKKLGQTNGNGNGEKKTTFATLPNTTTWQQQCNQQSQQVEQHSVGTYFIYQLMMLKNVKGYSETDEIHDTRAWQTKTVVTRLWPRN